MAGFFIDGCHLDDTPDDSVAGFHIDNPNAVKTINAFCRSRVLTLQVDGDERDAVLWGIANYKKP